MAISDKGTSEQRTDLAGSSGDNDLHVSSLRTTFFGETVAAPTANEGAD
jgi:hypothetical protein